MIRSGKSGEDFPRLLPRMQKTPPQRGYWEDSPAFLPGKKSGGGCHAPSLPSFPSDNAMGALGGLSAPFLLKKAMASSTEKISQNYTQRQTVREVRINA